MILYHGTNAKFNKFKLINKRIADDLYGGGVGYFTSDKNIGIGYAKSVSAKSGGIPYLYKVEISLKNIFNVNKIYTGKELLEILKHVKNLESFCRGAGLLPYGEDKYSVLSKIQLGSIELTGEKIWKGLSLGGIKTVEAQNILKSSGFDGLRYNGGVLTTDTHNHDVYLPYYDSAIKIQNIFKIVRPETHITPKDHPVDNQGLVEETHPMSPLFIDRTDLPQIKDPVEFCRNTELTYSVITRPLEGLIPSQSAYDYDKVREIIKNLDSTKPIVISQDGYIVDGHHRWVANYMAGEKNIRCFQIDCNILDILAHSKRLSARKISEMTLKKYNKSKRSI